MDVRFYDLDFNLLCIESRFKSVDWDLLFNGIGKFEMHCDTGSSLVGIALENKYIIAVQGDRQAIITTKRFEDNKFTLFGRTLNFLLSKKVLFSFDVSDFESNNLADVVTKLVSENFPEAEIVIDEGIDDICNFSSNTCTLYDAISKILEEKGMGHKLFYDIKNKKWIFHLLKEQKKDLLFSESLLNMYAFEKEDSILDEAKGGYYYQKITDMGEWDAYYNSPFLTVSPDNYGKKYTVKRSGYAMERNWTQGNVIICKNPDGTFEEGADEKGFYKYIGDDGDGPFFFTFFSNADTYEDAEKDIEKRKSTETVTAKVKNVKFNTDYFLGDIVRLSKKIGEKVIIKKMKITGINIWQESANEGEMPVFSEYKEEK